MADTVVHIWAGIWSHPNDDLLNAFRRGRLSPGHDLAVRSHIDLCRTCRDVAYGPERVAETGLQGDDDTMAADPATGPALGDLLARTLQRIDQHEALMSERSKAWLQGLDLPEALDPADIQARRRLAPGVWIAPLHLDGASMTSRTYLLGARRQTEVPDHSHAGQEITVVLSGYVEDQGHVYGPGDLILTSQDHTHGPVALDDCICLIAADAPLVMKGVVGRLVQVLAGI